MKVLSLDEFANCPYGTIFSEYKPCIVEGLYSLLQIINHDGCIDFYYRDLLPNCSLAANGQDDLDNPQKLEIGTSGRWGKFDKLAKFIVFDDADKLELIAFIVSGE